MKTNQLIGALRERSSINFIWGSGCSGLYRSSITMPGDPAIREAVKKYDDKDPLLSQIKRNFFNRTAGLEDAHSCLLALHPHERKRVLDCQTNWSNICMAELLRIGRAARVLTTNFDGSLVRATATFRMTPPLYQRDFPELRDAATPCIYLLGDAPPEILAGLLGRGAATGPWIVIGCSGKHFGLSRTLLSVDRYEQGLYWVGHFQEEPPAELRDGLFTSQRNAQWITGFDADSFMTSLLRELGEFPPPQLVPEGKKVKPAACLAAFESRRPEGTDLRPIMPEVQRLETAGSEEVQAFMEKYAREQDLSFRAGHFALGLGLVAGLLAAHHSPRLMKPFLIRAAELMEPDAPTDVNGSFSQLCCKLAEYSYGERARQWYARADACFAKMDFGPSCGAPVPYGHLRGWAKMLAEWACFEPSEQSEAIFDRARATILDGLAKWKERAAAPRPSFLGTRTDPFDRHRKLAIQGFIPEFHRRARMVPPARALELLAEARHWLEELRSDQGVYANSLAKHLFREAEVAPDRQAALIGEAEDQFRTLLRLFPDKTAATLRDWAGALGGLAKARSGEAALARYAEADRKFGEAEQIEACAVLYSNWSSLLIDEARERGGPAELWERARGFAERADALEAGKGSYNLACIAAETGDREGIAPCLERSAQYGKITRLSHILNDASLKQFRHDPWFRELLDGIFDAGLVADAR